MHPSAISLTMKYLSLIFLHSAMNLLLNSKELEIFDNLNITNSHLTKRQMKFYGQNRRPLYQILSENLMSGYASIAKPTLNQSEQIDVHVAITLSQIVSVDVNLHQVSMKY